MSLDDELVSIRQRTKTLLERLETEAQRIVAEEEQALRRAMALDGFTWCTLCNGTGAIERLDSGYMRRFGLLEWEGCPECGGEGEKRGKGYLPYTKGLSES